MAMTPPVGSPLSDSPAAQRTPDPGLPSGAAAQVTPAPDPQSKPPVTDHNPISHKSEPGVPPVSNHRPPPP